MRALAKRTGEPMSRLRQWRTLGLIGSEGPEEYAPQDIERVHLIQLLLRRGIRLEAISRAEKEHAFLGRYVESIFPSGVTSSCSLAEAAELVGMDPRTVQRLMEGLSDDRNLLDAYDVEALRGFKMATPERYDQNTHHQ